MFHIHPSKGHPSLKTAGFLQTVGASGPQTHKPQTKHLLQKHLLFSMKRTDMTCLTSVYFGLELSDTYCSKIQNTDIPSQTLTMTWRCVTRVIFQSGAEQSHNTVIAYISKYKLKHVVKLSSKRFSDVYWHFNIAVCCISNKVILTVSAHTVTSLWPMIWCGSLQNKSCPFWKYFFS